MGVLNQTRTASEYARALHLLLPPGEYFATDAAEQLMLAEGEELARIDAEINDKFQLQPKPTTDSWTINGYKALLSNNGMSNFSVYDHQNLPFNANTPPPNNLNDLTNASVIYIEYDPIQDNLIPELLKKLAAHKLIFTRIKLMSQGKILGLELPAELPAEFDLFGREVDIN